MGIITGGHVISGGTVLIDTGEGHILTIDGVPADGVAEIQDVDDGDASAGDYKLRVEQPNGALLGITTVIVFNETAANVQTILNAIEGVTVGLPTGVGSVADPYVITFVAPGGNIPLMAIVDDTTTGGAGAQVVANQAGVAGAYAGKIALGGLVKNNATGFVYENDGTQPIPTYTRIDTI